MAARKSEDLAARYAAGDISGDEFHAAIAEAGAAATTAEARGKARTDAPAPPAAPKSS